MEAALIPLAALLSFAIGVVATPLIASHNRGRGIVGVDVHKPHRPVIPEACGLAIVSAAVSPIAAAALIYGGMGYPEYAALTLLGLTAGLVGLWDDLKPLNPKVKPLLTALAGLPILLLHAYTPRPMLPFIGATRLTLVYPLLVLVGVAVTANAVNMMDVFNGVMPGTCGIIAASATITLMIMGRWSSAYASAALAGALAAFYIYNRYPARVFAGDSGSLFVGAMLGGLAVTGRLEVFMVVALMPHIMNAFYSLSSIGRLYERREVSSRPIRILKDHRLDASPDEGAPLTLARIILVHGPLDERGLIKAMTALTLLSSILAVLTLLVVPGVR
ncbi:MAG: hypothetical protein QW569_05800 [Candidatus Bathyarchaeia archaeon]|nr:hypothetical protein [Candidatus Bathyarchaeota archaeon]